MSESDSRIPNLFIAGAPKCGTTAFAASLAQHPNIYVGKKEPRYFDAPVFYDYPEDYPHKNLESYLSLYANDEARSAKYRVDASVFNMYHPDGIRRILRLEPNSKFIIILRDPVEAAQSMHAQRLKYTDNASREVSESFLYCWALMEKRRRGEGFPVGCKNRNLFRYDMLYDYGPHIDKLATLIPSGQLLLIDYEIFRKNAGFVYEKVFEYLDVSRIQVNLAIVNPSYSVKITRRNKIVHSIRNFLVKLPFRPKKSSKIAKKIIEAMTEKEGIRRLDGEALVDVEAHFQQSRKAMEDAITRYGINKL